MTKAEIFIDCDQCDGTGWIKEVRCGCREDDDDAQARRNQMGVVKSSKEKKT